MEIYKKLRKQNAVNNFLSTMDMTLQPNDHYRNLMYDARIYGWDVETIKAIVEGIGKAYDRFHSKI